MSHIIYPFLGLKNGHAFFNFKMKENFYIFKFFFKNQRSNVNVIFNLN